MHLFGVVLVGFLFYGIATHNRYSVDYVCQFACVVFLLFYGSAVNLNCPQTTNKVVRIKLSLTVLFLI